MAQRRYSQWDWGNMRYNYYVGSEVADPGGYQQLRGIRHEVPPRNDGGVVGLDLDQVLRPLPADARFIGTGTQAIGELVRSMRPTTRPTRAAGLGTSPDVVLEPMLDEMVAASGGTNTHPGVTVEALDHLPTAVAVTAGLSLGFGLGRSFGNGGRVFAWGVAALLGLMAAGARRKAFLQMGRHT